MNIARIATINAAILRTEAHLRDMLTRKRGSPRFEILRRWSAPLGGHNRDCMAKVEKDYMSTEELVLAKLLEVKQRQLDRMDPLPAPRNSGNECREYFIKGYREAERKEKADALRK